jgi:TatD DNase family protein
MFIDSHCHINFPELKENIAGVLSRMNDNAVSHALCVSVNRQSHNEVLDLARAHPNLYASVGVHPDEPEEGDISLAELVKLAESKEVVAIGETGLDYYRVEGDPEWQRERFRVHIRAARESGKPLIIHTRSAADDTLDIMRSEKASEIGGVMHCFTETYDVATKAMDMGFVISFSGIITFKNASELRETARKIPMERMLIETDSPYLAPVPYRGKTNEPAFVRYVADEIARITGLSAERVGEITSKNFFSLFNV